MGPCRIPLRGTCRKLPEIRAHSARKEAPGGLPGLGTVGVLTCVVVHGCARVSERGAPSAEVCVLHHLKITPP